MSSRPQAQDSDWPQYPNTILRFPPEPRHPGRILRVDLRAPITGADISALESRGLSEPFAVITAHDPHGLDLTPEENESRQSRLREELTARNAYFVEIDACSPDRDHCERSVATTLGYDDARELARAFGQVAIFWFDGQRFWIVGAVADLDPIALPRVL